MVEELVETRLAIPRLWRSARRASTTTTKTARATSKKGLLHAYRCRSGDRICRSSSMPARPMPTSPACSRRRPRRARFPSCCIASRAVRSLRERGLALGGYISFSGVVTFKSAEALRDIALAIPYDRLLVETDAPYLAPEPMRGKTNEPAFVAHTAELLASLTRRRQADMARTDQREFLPAVREGAAPAPPGRAAKRCMSLKVTILGSGSVRRGSAHRRRLGHLRSANPKNRRRRCSLLVERDGERGRPDVLVDTPPDSASSCSTRASACSTACSTPTIMPTTRTASMICASWPLMGTAGSSPMPTRATRADAPFSASTTASSSRPAVNIPPILLGRKISPRRDGRILSGAGGAIEALAFRQIHGRGETLGFRFGGLAYSPDVSDLPEESLIHLQGLDVWILDALRPTRRIPAISRSAVRSPGSRS